MTIAKAKVGMRVHVFSGDKSQELGFGVIESLDHIQFTDNNGNVLFESKTVPNIKLDNGNNILGCECWWVPEEWFLKLEKKKNKI